MKKQAKAKKLTEVRIGVIGVGNMGTSHISNIERGLISRARLTAICDIVPSKMDRYGDKYLKFTDSRALIRSGEVDAVMVETPHYDHTTIGIDALTQGVHTLVEKPISVHKADCERLIAAHTRNPKQVFAAMFNQRTNPQYIKLRELSLSYRLPTKWFQNVSWLSSIEMGLVGRNLLMWTPKQGLIDPDMTNYGNDLTSQYGEYYSSPSTRTIGANVKIVF